MRSLRRGARRRHRHPATHGDSQGVESRGYDNRRDRNRFLASRIHGDGRGGRIRRFLPQRSHRGSSSIQSRRRGPVSLRMEASAGRTSLLQPLRADRSTLRSTPSRRVRPLVRRSSRRSRRSASTTAISSNLSPKAISRTRMTENGGESPSSASRARPRNLQRSGSRSAKRLPQQSPSARRAIRFLTRLSPNHQVVRQQVSNPPLGAETIPSSHSTLSVDNDGGLSSLVVVSSRSQVRNMNRESTSEASVRRLKESLNLAANHSSPFLATTYALVYDGLISLNPSLSSHFASPAKLLRTPQSTLGPLSRALSTFQNIMVDETKVPLQEILRRRCEYFCHELDLKFIEEMKRMKSVSGYSVDVIRTGRLYYNGQIVDGVNLEIEMIEFQNWRRNMIDRKMKNEKISSLLEHHVSVEVEGEDGESVYLLPTLHSEVKIRRNWLIVEEELLKETIMEQNRKWLRIEGDYCWVRGTNRLFYQGRLLVDLSTKTFPQLYDNPECMDWQMKVVGNYVLLHTWESGNDMKDHLLNAKMFYLGRGVRWNGVCAPFVHRKDVELMDKGDSPDQLIWLGRRNSRFVSAPSLYLVNSGECRSQPHCWERIRTGSRVDSTTLPSCFRKTCYEGGFSSTLGRYEDETDWCCLLDDAGIEKSIKNAMLEQLVRVACENRLQMLILDDLKSLIRWQDSNGLIPAVRRVRQLSLVRSYEMSLIDFLTDHEILCRDVVVYGLIPFLNPLESFFAMLPGELLEKFSHSLDSLSALQRREVFVHFSPFCQFLVPRSPTFRLPPRGFLSLQAHPKDDVAMERRRWEAFGLFRNWLNCAARKGWNDRQQDTVIETISHCCRERLFRTAGPDFDRSLLLQVLRTLKRVRGRSRWWEYLGGSFGVVELVFSLAVHHRKYPPPGHPDRRSEIISLIDLFEDVYQGLLGQPCRDLVVLDDRRFGNVSWKFRVWTIRNMLHATLNGYTEDNAEIALRLKAFGELSVDRHPAIRKIGELGALACSLIRSRWPIYRTMCPDAASPHQLMTVDGDLYETMIHHYLKSVHYIFRCLRLSQSSMGSLFGIDSILCECSQAFDLILCSTNRGGKVRSELLREVLLSLKWISSAEVMDHLLSFLPNWMNRFSGKQLIDLGVVESLDHLVCKRLPRFRSSDIPILAPTVIRCIDSFCGRMISDTLRLNLMKNHSESLRNLIVATLEEFPCSSFTCSRVSISLREILFLRMWNESLFRVINFIFHCPNGCDFLVAHCDGITPLARLISRHNRLSLVDEDQSMRLLWIPFLEEVLRQCKVAESIPFCPTDDDSLSRIFSALSETISADRHSGISSVAILASASSLLRFLLADAVWEEGQREHHLQLFLATKPLDSFSRCVNNGSDLLDGIFQLILEGIRSSHASRLDIRELEALRRIEESNEVARALFFQIVEWRTELGLPIEEEREMDPNPCIIQ